MRWQIWRPPCNWGPVPEGRLEKRKRERRLRIYGAAVDLFRSHQQYQRMFEAPFLDAQVDAIDAGHMPAGSL